MGSREQHNTKVKEAVFREAIEDAELQGELRLTKSRSVAESDMVSEIADGVCQIIQVLIAGIDAEVRRSTARDN